MADLIIRGMKMPRGCLDCPMLSYWACQVTRQEIPEYTDIRVNPRPDWCPIVPLPAGHGRLIDAEAFEDAFIRYYLSQERNNHLVFTPVEIKQHLADMIGDWPTIIPAEGGNADG